MLTELGTCAHVSKHSERLAYRVPYLVKVAEDDTQKTLV